MSILERYISGRTLSLHHQGTYGNLSLSVPLCQILHCLLILLQLIKIVLFIVDSGCSKHMTGNLKLLINFEKKFLGTVKFGNDQIAPILGYEDLVQGAVTIKRFKEAVTSSTHGLMWTHARSKYKWKEICQTMALEYDSLRTGRKCQENVSHGDKTVTTSNELDLLFNPMFDELLNGTSKVVSKSFAVYTADALNQRQQPTTPLNNHTTPAPTCQTPTIAPTVISSENTNQAEPHAESDQIVDDEFINIFSTPV
nr:integrase, catalytic region, zinc finger, CCHC-type, peptidase aspartic, catalytic [Tanacetum cinerariifolium]